MLYEELTLHLVKHWHAEQNDTTYKHDGFCTWREVSGLSNSRNDSKIIRKLYSASSVTCVFARFSCTAVRAKALQIGKHEKKEPAMFPAPYEISSWDEKSEEKQQYDYKDLWFVKPEP